MHESGGGEGGGPGALHRTEPGPHYKMHKEYPEIFLGGKQTFE